ncbi:MAG: DNA/RNA nuclease SfsA [Chloroflexi bacterium]|nr:DNA/RNA nuclease SfsA [Chloroflexota bacterium]
MADSDAKLLAIPNAVECDIIDRLNRFVVRVEHGGTHFRASINNTGRLHEFIVAGRRAFCVPHDAHLKTDFRLFAIREGNLGALIDTQFQMAAFERALEMGLVPWLAGCRMVRRNAALHSSLIDYLLEGDAGAIYLEVKSAVLRGGDYAMYPDCPTERGRKHIRELTAHRRHGGRTVILFMAALPGARAFKPSREGDPELCRLLAEAAKSEVEIRALNIVYQPQESNISLVNPDLPVELF